MRRERYVMTRESLAHAQTAFDASLESNDPILIGYNRFALGMVQLLQGSLDGAEQELQASLRQAQRTGDATTRVLCLTYLTITDRKRGQVDAARLYALQSREVAAAAHMPAYVACAQGNLAWAAWREGDLAGASENGRAALDIWRKGQLVYPFQWTALWPLLAVASAQDRLSDAVCHARDLLDPAQLRLPNALAESLEQATGAWERGDRGAARASLDRAVGLAQETGYL